jgi:chromate transport protein ChrA
MAIVAFGLALGVEQVGEQLPGPAYALLTGLNSATVGIIALAAYQLSQKAITDTASRVIVFLGGAAGMLYNALWYFPVLMACGGLVTTVLDLRMLQRMLGKLRPREDPEAPSVRSVELTADRDEEDRGSLRSRRPGHHSPSDRLSMDNTSQTSRNQVVTSSGMLTSSWKAGTVLLCTFLATFVAVMACRAALGGKNLGFDLFANLYLAGTIIFGGGPVVVPLLREYIVTPGWVSPRNFLLGLAITQGRWTPSPRQYWSTNTSTAFPGPNFNFAVYLGALAISGTSIPMVGGAIIGFIGIFTPGIWLATSFMGFWSNIRKLQAVRACLRGVHAAAVGLVFTAVYRLFEQGYLDNEVQSGGSLGRDPWWVVIVATAFVGGLHFNLAPPLAIILGATMGLVQYGVAKA